MNARSIASLFLSWRQPRVLADADIETLAKAVIAAKVDWQPGPPPGRGRWWIVLNGITVQVVAVEPALTQLDNPVAPLLVKTLGGLAYPLSEYSKLVTHHALFVTPESP